jgi:DNA-binding NtrC family response regulator
LDHSTDDEELLTEDNERTIALLGVADGDKVRRLRLLGVDGAAAGIAWESTGDRCSIGSHPANDLVIDDVTVSRFHCEIVIDSRGARLRDLESMNGTIVDGTQIYECLLRGGSLVRIGRSTLRFELAAAQNQLPISEVTGFGRLVGHSVAMRTTFAVLERAAATDVTVLLNGETGTGKQVAAEAIHEHSGRAEGPLITVDCGGLPGNLLESELFGHEKGAFTGAGERRIGAFEEASGGTLFLDEIGELPLDLQPKLLRALEERTIRRVGSNRHFPIDVRVIAATNRDLRAEVNGSRFREDLYFRLAVVQIHLPPLRERPEDIPMLVDALLARMKIPDQVAARLRERDMIDRLAGGAWPGNVRELRNFLQRYMVFEDAMPVGRAETESERHRMHVDVTQKWQDERARIVADFERRYLEELLRRHDHVVARAARAAGLDRVYLYKLLRRYDLTPSRR